MDLQASSRTTATLGVLALILVLGVAWALHKVTEPFPTKADEQAPICEDTSVSAGSTVQVGQVLVNVLNGGDKAGLAQSTQAGLSNFGFATGDLGNYKLKRSVGAVVWAADPKGAAAQLVASYLGKDVQVVRHRSDYLGITVVVGDRFRKVRRGMPSIKADRDTTVCEPTTDSANEGL